VRQAERGRKGRRLPPGEAAEVCRAFQEAALDVLVEKTLLAARRCDARRIVVGGGVAANGRLREKLCEAAAKKRVYFPRMAFCMDNAAMIGSLGEDLYRLGRRSDLRLGAHPNLEVAVCR